MKDSGIPWIGEIPAEWCSARLKNEGTLHGRIGWNGLRSDEFEENSYAYLITGQDFISSNIDWARCYQIRKERYDEDEFIQLKEGDLLITKDGTIGKVAVVSNMDKPACLNSGIFVLRQKNLTYTPRYLYWFLASPMLKTYNDYMNLGGTTIIHLYQNFFERMPILIPPINEQQSIADFLDKKCGEIDEMVALQERIIEELKAYKQSVITEAVTNGLNPNVPMKDSGIEWIGKIPEHWLLASIRYLNNGLTDGTHGTYQRTLKGHVLLSSKNVRENDLLISSDESLISETDYQEIISNGFPKMGDLLLCCIGASIGRCIIYNLNEPHAFQRSVVFIRCNHFVLPSWLRNCMLSSMVLIQESILINQSAQAGLYQNQVKDILVTVPPIEEQQAIANYLDEKCVEIDTLISVRQSKIDALKEYKKSIIYEYVTGKKSVNA